ncbi:MAG: hypothetical protein JXB03_11915, partial [Spirochaetales bacterium]|nr:hypothetical protein [Spirochaetales bacterium]
SFAPLETVTRYFFADGKVIATKPSMDDTAGEIASRTIDTREQITRYLARCRNLFTAVEDAFLWNNPRDVFFSGKSFSILKNVPMTAFTRSMDAMTKASIRDPHTRQIFNRYATFNGSNPYKARGMFNLIAALESASLTPEKGIFALSQALEGLALKKGARFHYNTKVTALTSDSRRIHGITAGGRYLETDYLVSNMDIHRFTRDLLPRARRDGGDISVNALSSSGIVFLWGINRSFPRLGLHNIFFARNYREEFRFLSGTGRTAVYEDPTVYVNITSKVDPSDAPEGMENWFVLINMPCDRGQDWDRIIPEVRTRVLAKLSTALSVDLSDHITEEAAYGPKDIEQDTASYRGSLYGMSSNKWNSAFLRPRNSSRACSNLYFCGGTVHPGGGMPLAVLSGRLAAKELMS